MSSSSFSHLKPLKLNIDGDAENKVNNNIENNAENINKTKASVSLTKSQRKLKRQLQPKRRANRIAVNGLLLLDKPRGMGSNQALQKIKYKFNAIKAGHVGTLDPLASGLLPICFGEATKFAQYLSDADKRYTATIQLGIRTDSGDAEGKIIANRPIKVDLKQIQTAVNTFLGPIQQTPPMYSALKHQGKALYEYARAGQTIERRSRLVHLYAIEIMQWQANLGLLTLDVHCSKGTYIRSLADDLGEVLECGGHLQVLRRTAIGPLSINNAHALLENVKNAENNLQPAKLYQTNDTKHDLQANYANIDDIKAEDVKTNQTHFVENSALQNHLTQNKIAQSIQSSTQSSISASALALPLSSSSLSSSSSLPPLLPLPVVVSQLPAYQLNEALSRRFQQGQRIAIQADQLGLALSWLDIVAAIAQQTSHAILPNHLSIKPTDLLPYKSANHLQPRLTSDEPLTTSSCIQANFEINSQENHQKDHQKNSQENYQINFANNNDAAILPQESQAIIEKDKVLAIYNAQYELLGTARYDGEVLSPTRLVNFK